MISALAASLHPVSQPTVTASARHEFCLSSETISKLELVTLFDCGQGQTPHRNNNSAKRLVFLRFGALINTQFYSVS